MMTQTAMVTVLWDREKEVKNVPSTRKGICYTRVLK